MADKSQILSTSKLLEQAAKLLADDQGDLLNFRRKLAAFQERQQEWRRTMLSVAGSSRSEP
jgi:hypothetical protein